MAEILWLVGGKKKAVVAVLNAATLLSEYGGKEEEQDEVCSFHPIMLNTQTLERDLTR